LPLTLETTGLADLKRTELSVKQEKAILVGVLLPETTADPRDPLGELASLAKTAGARVAAQIFQKRSRPDASTYCGSGKAIEAAQLAMKHRADVIIFDNDLSPAQIGALERIVNQEANKPLGEGIKVLDRSELILDIFATRAQTSEAKLQVQLAQMEYTYPRLTRMWGHLERIAAGGAIGIGTRGPGEQQLEIDRRLVRKRISDLKREIALVQQRKSRMVAKRNAEHTTICVVGYTNAGKSTLFNTLTGAGTYADDKLFATLDTKTRLWKFDRGSGVMLSDTVGFVRDLPHHLVASFRATLEEAVHADLLLHVLDVGHPHAQQQYKSVHDVLSEIGAGDKPEVLLLNKIDTEEGEQGLPFWRSLYPDAIPISARTGRGLDQLILAVTDFVRGQTLRVTLAVEATDGKLLSYIESHARVCGREFEDGRFQIDCEMGKRIVDQLARNEHVEVLRSREVEL
jgi:GTP-binding protein HflX